MFEILVGYLITDYTDVKCLSAATLLQMDMGLYISGYVQEMFMVARGKTIMNKSDDNVLLYAETNILLVMMQKPLIPLSHFA